MSLKSKPVVKVIIPAYNEENAVGNVVQEVPMDLVKEVVVVNNASTDKTAEEARASGATVLNEQVKGYGRACLKGIDHINASEEKADIVVFLDADYSDYPEEMRGLVNPIIHDGFDLVIGSRALGNKEKGAMTPQQIFGNKLATFLLRLLYGVRFTDLGPFRAIKWDSLVEMKMEDKTFGWTVEMQLKAAKTRDAMY